MKLILLPILTAITLAIWVYINKIKLRDIDDFYTFFTSDVGWAPEDRPNKNMKLKEALAHCNNRLNHFKKKHPNSNKIQKYKNYKSKFKKYYLYYSVLFIVYPIGCSLILFFDI